jgi:hypothetical protein
MDISGLQKAEIVIEPFKKDLIDNKQKVFAIRRFFDPSLSLHLQQL